jgi:hypothetical protein
MPHHQQGPTRDGVFLQELARALPQVGEGFAAAWAVVQEVRFPLRHLLRGDAAPGQPVPVAEIHFREPGIYAMPKALPRQPSSHLAAARQRRSPHLARQLFPPRHRPDAVRQALGPARVHRQIGVADAAAGGTVRLGVAPHPQ